MSSKKEYFIKRNSSLSKDNRAYAAKREIETIRYILKTFINFELTL